MSLLLLWTGVVLLLCKGKMSKVIECMHFTHNYGCLLVVITRPHHRDHIQRHAVWPAAADLRLKVDDGQPTFPRRRHESLCSGQCAC